MKRKNIKLTAFLSLAVACFGFGFNSPAFTQETSRQRVAAPTPTVTPTPQVNPAVVPTPVPTPFTTSVSKRTLSDLQAQIRLVLSRPELRRGHIGVKIVSLDTNKTVFEENAEKYFMPASNMKSYTIAAALEKLSPNFRFVTSVYAPAPPDETGTIRGDLTIYGRGDISISTSFNNGDYHKGIDSLTDKIVQAGVKRIEGNLVGDESYFSGNPIPLSWEWDDLQWYYGAEVSALPLNDNALDLSVKPSSTVGALCIAQALPFNPVMRIVNRCVTSAGNVKRDLRIVKKLDQNILEITGTMPLGDRGFSGYVTVSRPANLFLALLRQNLQQRGIVITGQNRLIDASEKINIPSVTPMEIAKLESPPLSLIAAKTMKPSQNLYTETILWTLGEQMKMPLQNSNATDKNPLFNSKATSSERGIYVVQEFLRQIGIAPDSVIQWDGSGLSRHNLITPASAVELYSYMAKQSPFKDVWMESLTIGGIDGTLKNRFKGTTANGNVRGKTGTIDQVSALSGYVTTASGERLVFSILVNSVNQTNQRTATIDDIVVLLSKFDGRIN
ncbi:MAG TPA: D-alanyl-D-alanine carboxypeptidase/D-alanyl-D-alanine-endopeptidase [Pyrinomonadaceae bacterium]|nr:D-alanyl-D-alanine carboxypeptidase/D-alanyl-D-alanine-endopeptidase [Pyrinomonadaceae bacterium]